MILLMNGNGFLGLIIGIYLVCHIPAFIMLIVGLVKLKSKPDLGKKLLIAAMIYFIIGLGVCGAMLG